MAPDPNDETRPHASTDVRLLGFRHRVPLEEAIRWVDEHPTKLSCEEVRLDEVVGRVPQAAWRAPADLPKADCAGMDGYAVRSEETLGAGNYSPLVFAVREPGASVGGASVSLVSWGTPLPRGANGVLPFDAVQPKEPVLEVCSVIAPGMGTERKGQQVRSGAAFFENAQPLRPQDVGLIASFGIERIQVIRRPRVGLLVVGPRPAGSGDANLPLLRALVARDGGISEIITLEGGSRETIAGAIAETTAEVLLVAGRTGTGLDDEAPLALAEAGKLDLHGVAVRPGGSAGMGKVGSVPVILLPGYPLACLCTYDLLAGRLIRRLGGRAPELPYLVRGFELTRKIVSAIGTVDLCRVRLIESKAAPVGGAETGGLASAVHADGFVLVPAGSEGYPPGAQVPVHLYRELRS